MFTGIVKEIGSVSRIDRRASICRLDVNSLNVSKDVEIGGSVAVNGACLTVTAKAKGVMTFDVMSETLMRTAFSSMKEGDPVNLEGALRVGDPMDGHFVTGHIDCAGKITSFEKRGGEASMEIEVGWELVSNAVEKGCVAIDGVSLTVGKLARSSITVYLIPYTLKSSTLGLRKTGDAVNVEFDILGKHAAASSVNRRSMINEAFLKGKGF